MKINWVGLGSGMLAGFVLAQWGLPWGLLWALVICLGVPAVLVGIVALEAYLDGLFGGPDNN